LPNGVILQCTPSNRLCGLGKHCFDFHLFNRVSRQLRFDRSTDQKVYLFGHGLDRRLFGQQQLFRVHGVHKSTNSATVLQFPRHRLSQLNHHHRFVTDPMRRAELDAWLLYRVRPMFDQRVLEVSEDVMFKWRLLVEGGRKIGHTFSQPDLIIAATALQHGLTVVTRDTGDYRLARVPLFNPWLDESA
jgi:predicted nucleic acid-binding protein